MSALCLKIDRLLSSVIIPVRKFSKVNSMKGRLFLELTAKLKRSRVKKKIVAMCTQCNSGSLRSMLSTISMSYAISFTYDFLQFNINISSSASLRSPDLNCLATS